MTQAGNNEGMARRVCVINFKGGVGKTTLAFHLGTGLTRFHDQRVLLIDMDHQSSLSIVCLGAIQWGESVEEKKTIDEVFRPFIGQTNALPGDEIISRSILKKNKKYDQLHLVAASLSLDDVEIEMTATHQGNAILSEWNKRTLICRWIQESNIEDKYDYIIFDCPPATKVVSQNAIVASHSYVIPVVPEAVMERGTPHLHQMISTGIDSRMKALSMSKIVNHTPIYVPDTKLAGVVVTRIKTSGGYSGYTNEHTQRIRSLKANWKEDLVEPYIVDGVGISEALSEGVPVYDRSNTQNVGERNIHTLYEDLTGELKRRIDER